MMDLHLKAGYFSLISMSLAFLSGDNTKWMISSKEKIFWIPVKNRAIPMYKHSQKPPFLLESISKNITWWETGWEDPLGRPLTSSGWSLLVLDSFDIAKETNTRTIVLTGMTKLKNILMKFIAFILHSRFMGKYNVFQAALLLFIDWTFRES